MNDEYYRHKTSRYSRLLPAIFTSTGHLISLSRRRWSKASMSDQIFCTLDEGIDTAALVRAWQRVFDRHANPSHQLSLGWRSRSRFKKFIARLKFLLKSIGLARLDSLRITPRAETIDIVGARSAPADSIYRDAPITRLKLIQCAEHQYKLLVDLSPYPGGRPIDVLDHG